MNYTEKGSKLYLFSIVLVAVIGGLLFGYDTAVISGADKGLQAFFMGASDFVYTDTIHGITSSSALIGCIIGSALSGFFASNLGRKNSLFIAGVLFFLSALGSYYPEFLFFDYGVPSYSLLVAFNFYRVLGGIGVVWHRPSARCILRKLRRATFAGLWYHGISLPLSSASWWFTS